MTDKAIKAYDRVQYQRRGRNGEALGKPVVGFVLYRSHTAVYIHDNATGNTVAASITRVRRIK